MPDGGDLPPWCVFTAPMVADRVLDASGWTEAADLSSARLLEPTAGDGALAVPAARRLIRSFRRHRQAITEETLKRRIVALELRPSLAAHLVAAVEEALVDEGLPMAVAMAVARHWCRCDDFLATDLASDFTHVVGNPPFARGKGGSADMCVPFIARGFDLLGHDGRMATIAPLSLASSRGATPFRTVVGQEGTLERVIPVADGSPFLQPVAVATGIFVLARRSSSHDGTGPSPSWFLGSPEIVDVFHRLHEEMPTLEDVGCRIRVGMATGANEVFIGVPEDMGVETDVVMPVVDTRDLGPETVRWSGRVILDTRGPTGRCWSARERPGLYRYLSSHKARLQRRRTVADGGDWRATLSRLDRTLAASPKLLIPETSARARVVLDPGGHVPLNSLHAVTSTVWPLKALQAFLSIISVGLVSNALDLRRKTGSLRLNATHLRHAPVPDWSDVSRRHRVLLLSDADADRRRAVSDICRLTPAMMRRCSADGPSRT